jgi:hypothetical protein
MPKGKDMADTMPGYSLEHPLLLIGWEQLRATPVTLSPPADLALLAPPAYLLEHLCHHSAEDGE